MIYMYVLIKITMFPFPFLKYVFFGLFEIDFYKEGDL